MIETGSDRTPLAPPPRPLRAEIRPRSLREEVANLLQRAIITGTYKPGQRLVERELITQFGVSSIPIREALQDLESRGLVVKRHNYGCSVIQLGPEDLERICDLRRVLEPQMAAWAAARMTKEQGCKLQDQLDRMTTAANAGDLSSFFHDDLLFHQLMWEAADNRYAMKALESALGSLFAAGLIRGKESKSLDLHQVVHKHACLLEALRAADGAAAAQVLMDIAGNLELNAGL